MPTNQEITPCESISSPPLLLSPLRRLSPHSPSAICGEEPPQRAARQWLSPTQIAEKLGAKGYKVVEIEADDGAYEVEMTDKNGVRIESHVHPKTGRSSSATTTDRKMRRR